MTSPATFLVVGDIHNFWRPEDVSFIEQGSQDLTLFVGDLGDEDLGMVREVAGLKAPKAVILGNHDAWQSFSRRRPTRTLEDSVEILGDDHIAYEVREMPQAGMSIVGARPFSWGGKSMRSPEVYDQFYGVGDIEASAQKIVQAAQRASARDLLILAHNGPTGLGKQSHSIYGKDFGRHPSGDWGDRDLELAIDEIRNFGLRVRCVIAGHMHHRLLNPKDASRVRFMTKDGVLYVNPAVVPRIKESGKGERWAYYLRMSCCAGDVVDLEEIWVDDQGEIREVVVPEIMET